MKDLRVWNECFDKIEERLKVEPIHHRDPHNVGGPVMLRELYEKSEINFENGLDTLVDLIAHIMDENGYEIIQRKK